MMARYRVVGSNEVLGYRREDGEFQLELDPVTEARLTVGGHIERVRRNENLPESKSVPESDLVA